LISPGATQLTRMFFGPPDRKAAHEREVQKDAPEFLYCGGRVGENRLAKPYGPPIRRWPTYPRPLRPRFYTQISTPRPLAPGSPELGEGSSAA
jgi:hypothetical protein